MDDCCSAARGTAMTVMDPSTSPFVRTPKTSVNNDPKAFQVVNGSQNKSVVQLPAERPRYEWGGCVNSNTNFLFISTLCD